MIIGVAGKVLDRNVGGNTRYARNVYDGIEAAGHRVVRLGDTTKKSYLLAEALNYPNSFKGHLIHYPADTGSLVPSNKPTVVTVHGLASLHDKSVRSPLRQTIWNTRVKRLCTVADHVITVSHSSKNDLMTGMNIPEANITVIPHGIDHTRFRTANPADDDTTVLEPLNLAKQYMLYLGNIEPRKNIVEMVKAADQLADLDIPLVIAGKPAWEADGIMETITASRNVHYVGRVDEEVVVPLMRQASAFLFPSKYEGFGFPVLEAMACGTPVICSNRGSLREVAADAAEIVPSLDAEAIAHGVRNVLTDPDRAHTLTQRGLLNVQKYTWADSVTAHLNLFKEIADVA